MTVELEQHAGDEERSHRPPRDDLVRAVFPGLEYRDDGGDTGDGSIGTLTGHLAVWNQWTEINSIFEGRFMERFAPGSFTKYLREQGQPRVTFQHGRDPQAGDKPLGPPRRIEPDQIGMYYEVPLLDTSYNRDLLPGLKAGLYGSSMRFSVVKEDFNPKAKRSAHNPEGLPERTVQEATLPEFGPVTFPAYAGADAEARAGVRSMTDEFMLAKLQQHPERAARLIEAVTHSNDTDEPQPALVETTALPADGADASHSDEGSRSEPDEAQAEETRATDSPPAVAEPPTENKTVDTPTIEERRSRVDEITARLKEINDEAGVAELKSEVQSEWDQLTEERSGHERAMKAYEDRSQQFAEAASKPENRSAGVTVIDRSSTRAKVPGNIYDLSEYRSLSRDDGEMRQALRDGAMRSIETARFPHPAANADKIRSHLERLLDADRADEKDGGKLSRHILATGNPVYARSYWRALSGRYLSTEEQRALATVGSTQLADGGYAVPYQLDPTIILTSDGSTNPLRAISRVEQITGNTWKGVTSAGITVSRGAEEAAITPTSPTLAQPSVTVQAVKAEIQFSIEADEDWPRLQGEMAVLLQDAKDAEEANAFVNGTGATVNPEGVVYGLDATSDVGTTGDGFDLGDIDRLVARLPDRFEPRASFLAHRAIYSEIETLARAAGVNEPPLAAGSASTLKGYPRRNSSAMEDDFTTSGNEILLFGDFNYFLIVDKIGLGLEIDPHVRDGDGKWTGQRALLAHYRNSSLILADNAFRLLKVGVVTS